MKIIPRLYNSITPLACPLFAVFAAVATPVHATSMVLDWNELFTKVIKESTVNQNPGYASRSMAMMNIGIYDSYSASSSSTNSSTFYDYGNNYRGTTNDATSEVAAAQAAYTVLSSLYSDKQSVLDVFRSNSLAGYGASDRSSGVALGNKIGNTILSNRANDGWNANVSYTYDNTPGSFQPDPLNPSVPVWGPGWGDVKTFAIRSTDDFAPAAPPAITSARYAASYNEVKSLGAANSTTRTADQTETGLFWAYDRSGMGTPMVLFNNTLRNIAVQEGNTSQENAELFARSSVALADAGITAWSSKFDNNLWRAVSAIHAGDSDGNAGTVGDTDWVALGAPDGEGEAVGFTPQFPTYLSGHATFGAALFKSLEQFYGTDDIAFDIDSDELKIILADPALQAKYGIMLEDSERSFSSFSEAMAENGRSRVYLGIHFDFDDTVGQEVGMDIASSIYYNEFVAAHVPEPSSSLFMLSGLVMLTLRRAR